eukprot:747595-Hanusia_phi.AAC.2
MREREDFKRLSSAYPDECDGDPKAEVALSKLPGREGEDGPDKNEDDGNPSSIDRGVPKGAVHGLEGSQ